ncbi:MAG: flippase-like domain-containing protein [Nitriliruptorales bacterium]|nr:flippase-like domain-containing protein [Nitriliruptorales bacterium]
MPRSSPEHTRRSSRSTSSRWMPAPTPTAERWMSRRSVCSRPRQGWPPDADDGSRKAKPLATQGAHGPLSAARRLKEGGGLGSQHQTLRLAGAEFGQTGDDVESQPGPHHRVLRRALLAGSLAAVGVVAWGARQELRDALGVIRTLPPGMLLIGLLLEGGAVAALAQVYRASLEATGARIRYRQGLQLSMGAFTLSRVLPGGGAAGAVWAVGRLRQYGVPRSVAAAAVVVEGLLAMVTLGTIVTIGAVAALFRGRVTVGGVLAACTIPVLFAVLAWAAAAGLRSPAVRTRFFSAVRRILRRRHERVDVWESATDDLAGAMASGAGVWPVMGWSAVNWLFDIAALWMVFLGLGAKLEIGVLVLGFGVANLITALPHTPGGLGLVEAGMTGTYVGLGADTAVALAAVLAYRVISFWIPVIVGVPQYLRAPAAGTAT